MMNEQQISTRFLLEDCFFFRQINFQGFWRFEKTKFNFLNLISRTFAKF